MATVNPRIRRDLPLAEQLLARPPPAPSSRPVSPLATSAPASSLSRTLSPSSNLPSLFPHPSSTEPTDALADLHARLYNVIALALRAYIQQWYGRISPRDLHLLPTITSDIIAPIASHLALAFEPSNKPHIHALLLSHIPTLAATHLRALSSARDACDAGFTPSLPDAYHARLALRSVALAPAAFSSGKEVEYALSPMYLTALADALLKTALPQRQYVASAQRLMVREVVARAVLGNVAKRLVAPWFWAEIVLKRLPPPSPPPPPPSKDKLPLPARVGAGAARAIDMAARLWSTLLALALGVWNAAIFLMAAWSGSAPPASSTHTLDPWLALVRSLALFASPTPPLQLRLLLGALDTLGTLLGPAADRLAPYLLDLVLTPATGARITAILEKALFPDGWPGPPPIEPAPEEQVEMLQKLRAELRSTGVGKVARVVGMDAGSLVDILADAGCNAHLVGMVLDAGVVALVPELRAALDDEPADISLDIKLALKAETADKPPHTPEITVEIA